MGVVNTGSPLAHSLGNRVLQCSSTARYGYYGRSEKAHTVDVQRLTLGVLLAHEHDALHAEQSRRSSSCNSVLTCACLRNEAGLAHFLREQSLSEDVVYLVRARVIEVLALEVYLRSAERICQLLRVVEQRRSARVFLEQVVELAYELGVVLVVLVLLFELYDGVHQRLRDILSAVYAEASLFISHINFPFVLRLLRTPPFSFYP